MDAVRRALGKAGLDPSKYCGLPFLKGSVMDWFSVTRRIPGLAGLSTAMSPKDRWHFGSSAPSLGTVISPDLRKAKKPKQHAAHSITVSDWSDVASHTPFMFRSIPGDIGSLSRF